MDGDTAKPGNEKLRSKIGKEASRHKDGDTENRRKNKMLDKMGKQVTNQKDGNTHKNLDMKRGIVLKYSKQRKLDGLLYTDKDMYSYVTWTLACNMGGRLLLPFLTKFSTWH